MISIMAEDRSKLLKDLDWLSCGVPERGRGQKTTQKERWHFVHLAPLLASAGFLSFPLKVIFADRPDVRLEMPSGSIGLELREVVPPAYAQADAIANEFYPNAMVDRSLFTWGAQFSPTETHALLSRPDSQLTGSPWIGDQVEQELAEAVNEAIMDKVQKLNEPGFSKFEGNWLSIYTSSPGGPRLDISHTATLLAYPTPDSGRHTFNVIFLLVRDKLVILKERGSQVHEAPELSAQHQRSSGRKPQKARFRRSPP